MDCQAKIEVFHWSRTAENRKQRHGMEILERVRALDWKLVDSELSAQGNAVLRSILSQQECESLARCYSDDEMFRSRIVMARHGFGRGEYKYFKYPLPEKIVAL